MILNHKVCVNVSAPHGRKQEVLQSRHMSLPKKLLSFFFGDFCDIIVLTPGETARGIEIKEVDHGGGCCAKNC